MLKRSISVLLALIMVFGIFTIIPFSASAETSGQCGDDVYWSLSDDGVLEIYGSESMTDYSSYSDVPWYSNRYNIRTVVISRNITTICNHAFRDCVNLTSVNISDSVTIIGFEAFSNCQNLTEVIIPDSVTIIGDEAFQNCSMLTSVTIPDSVTSIGNDAFRDCSSLTEVTIPNSVTGIGEYAFAWCSSLTEVTIPDSFTYIVHYAFYCCTSLTKVTIPESVKSIGSDAFHNCKSLKDVYYAGSESDWKKIMIGSYNEPLINATIHYNSTGPDSDDDTFTVLGEEFKHNLFDYAKHLDPTQYHPELAHLMMTFANAAYTPDRVKTAYSQLGLKGYDSKFYDEILADYGTVKSALSMGYVRVDSGGICVLVSIKGTGGGDFSQGFLEWMGNFSIEKCKVDNDVLYKNFYDTMMNVYGELYKYIYIHFGGAISELNNIKYFITGHSRGAAVANLLEVKLNKLVGMKNVYGYNFAVPDVTLTNKSRNLELGNNNIFNVSNVLDIVSYSPGIFNDGLYFLAAESSFSTDLIEAIKNIRSSKFGVSVWFSEKGFDNFNYDNLTREGLISIAGSQHPGYVYLDYLRNRNPIEKYQRIYYDGIMEYWRPYKMYGNKMHLLCCPIDVELCDENGTVIVSVIDGEIIYNTISGYSDVMVETYEAQKVFVFPSDKNYSLRIIGSDTGTMDYYIEEYDGTDSMTTVKTFEDVALEIGKEMVGKAVNVIDSDDQMIHEDKLITVGDEPMEILTDGEEVPYTFSYILGDADGNGEVDIIDATWMQRFMVDIETPYDLDTLMQGDVDYNGDIEITDVTYVQRWLVQIHTPYLIGTDVVFNKAS